MTRRNHPKRQEDRKERAKHGLDGDDEDLMKDLMQMEASGIRFPPLKQRIPADWNLDELGGFGTRGCTYEFISADFGQFSKSKQKQRFEISSQNLGSLF